MSGRLRLAIHFLLSESIIALVASPNVNATWQQFILAIHSLTKNGVLDAVASSPGECTTMC